MYATSRTSVGALYQSRFGNRQSTNNKSKPKQPRQTIRYAGLSVVNSLSTSKKQATPIEQDKKRANAASPSASHNASYKKITTLYKTKRHSKYVTNHRKKTTNRSGNRKPTKRAENNTPKQTLFRSTKNHSNRKIDSQCTDQLLSATYSRTSPLISSTTARINNTVELFDQFLHSIFDIESSPITLSALKQRSALAPFNERLILTQRKQLLADAPKTIHKQLKRLLDNKLIYFIETDIQTFNGISKKPHKNIAISIIDRLLLNTLPPALKSILLHIKANLNNKPNKIDLFKDSLIDYLQKTSTVPTEQRSQIIALIKSLLNTKLELIKASDPANLGNQLNIQDFWDYALNTYPTDFNNVIKLLNFLYQTTHPIDRSHQIGLFHSNDYLISQFNTPLLNFYIRYIDKTSDISTDRINYFRTQLEANKIFIAMNEKGFPYIVNLT
ncbi:hypothetical protein DID75_05305 [Candidatus Marinamargulisbacteria bacterium SCGC AG-410-N11]|nr:hypothetical protein DID75_05305 [Candidatus Marinamargulisbacteria bacterium SCGC AG-410-N11]